MATFQSARNYNLGLTFRSVFEKGDEYKPPVIQLPQDSKDQLYDLLNKEYRSVTQQGLDATAAIITLSLDDIPKDLLERLDHALKDGYASADAGVKDAMGVYASVPANTLTGFLELPGNWSALVCKDERGAFKVCGMGIEMRVINADTVIDFSLYFAEPFPK